jgi:DNA-binding Lrp family transcriptional regulator
MATPKDLEILDQLSRDSDRSRKTISVAVGISEPSLSKRISVLQAEGVITRFTIDINYEAVGYAVHAFSLVKLKQQNAAGTAAVVERVKQLNEAMEIYSSFGDTDLFIRWICKNPAALMHAVSRITDDENVAHVETVTLAQVHKSERGPLLNRAKDVPASS